MPHLFTNRRRLHDLTASSADIGAQFRWETINAVAYKLGGLVFIIGSILFFPAFEGYADVGAWTFSPGPSSISWSPSTTSSRSGATDGSHPRRAPRRCWTTLPR
jgi:hypothetical protein